MATQLSRAATDGTLDEVIKDTTGQDIVNKLTALANAVKPDASDIPYDSNTTVKGKIDEICTDLIQTKTYTVSYTAGGNASVALTANDFNVTTPSGYTPIGISDFASQSVDVAVRGIYGRASGTNTIMSLRNMSSNSVTATAYITILYIKSIFL